MRKYKLSLFLIIGIYSCNSQQNNSSKYHQQFVVAREFLNKLKANDTAGVRAIIGVDFSMLLLNEEIFSCDVKQLSEMLKSHELPNEKTYKLIEYPVNDPRLLDMKVPIGNDTLIIRFVKYLPSNKIAGYYINRQISNDYNLITLPPDSLKR